MSDSINKFWNVTKQLLCKHEEYVFVHQKFVPIEKKKFKLIDVEACKDCGKEREVEII